MSVDGIEPPPITMISTSIADPANSTSAEISWKTVTKGFRSATRRPRKIARSLNIAVQPYSNPTKEETSATESEELGVAVLGHRFSDKIDHLPIKKRRSMQRSLSPPSRIPFDGAYASVLGQDTRTLDELLAVQTSRSVENPFVNRKFPCIVDSYGIELLAAAACNTSVNDDAHNVKVGSAEKNSRLLGSDAVHNVKGDAVEENSTFSGSDAPVTASSMGKNTVCFENESSLLKDARSEHHGDSGCQLNSSAQLGDSYVKVDSKAGKGSSSGKDARLHWDLNTVPDEWELPTDHSNIGCPRSGSENGAVEGLRSVEGENLESHVKHSDTEHAWELLKCSAGVNVSAQVISKTKGLDSGLYTGSNLISGKSSSAVKRTASTAMLTVQDGEDCCRTSGLQLGQSLALENVQLGKEAIMIGDAALSEKGVCEMVKLKSDDEVYELPNIRNTLNLIGTTLDADDPSITSGKVDPSCTSVLGTTIEEGQSFPVDMIERDDKNVSATIATPVDSSSEVELKKFMPKSYGEATLEDPLDDGDVSDLSLGGHDHLVSSENMFKCQADYESPVEDGELREWVAHSWQENEGETDCLDYDIDDRDAVDFGISNQCMSEAGSDSNRIDNNVNSTEKVSCGKVDASKESTQTVTIGNSASKDPFPEGCGHVAKTIEVNDVKPGEIVGCDSGHKFDVEGSLEGKVGSRGTSGKLLMHVQGFAGSQAFDGKDSKDMPQQSSSNDFQDGQLCRSNYYCGKDKSVPCVQDRAQKNNQDGAISGNWDSRNHYQNGGYRRGDVHPRKRSNILDSEANVDGLAFDDQRRPRSYHMKDGYRSLVGRRPQDERDNSLRRGNFATGDDSHYINRGRSEFCRRAFVRGIRDDYRDPIGDDSAPSVWAHRNNNSARRHQCSSSPVYSRDANFSHLGRKSRSRSRTRSPIQWHMQKERKAGVGRISRSPDFRSEARMRSNRMHYQDSKFSENDEGFFSPPRRRFSSQGHSGFFNDRNSGPTRFRERNSPGRYFGPRPRFGSNGSTAGRMRSDDCFRNRLNSQRFSEQSGVGWRGHSDNYDGSDSERPRYNGGKHDMIRRVRHSDTGGAGRRFQNDAEDYFEDHCARNNKYNGVLCSRRTEKTGMLRKSWEGRGQFKYDTERTHNIGSKLPRDYDEDITR